MKILVVLWTVSLVRLCSAGCCGKSKTTDNDNGAYGESKENLRNTHKPSGQSVASPQVKRGVEQSTNEATPQAPQNPPKDPTTSKESPVVQPAPQQTAKPGSVPEDKQEQKPAKNLQGSVKKEHAQQGQTQANAQPADKPVESPETAEDIQTDEAQGDQPTQSPTQSLQAPTAGRSSQSTPADESPKPTNPVTLNLTDPDESKLDVHTETKSEVTVKYHYPKDTSKDTTVMDGNKELWTGGANDRCLSCLIYKKGSMELLKIVVVESGSTVYKYFEKCDEEWKKIDKKDYDQKLTDMSKSVSSPNPSSHPSTQSK
ncbi:signal peptide containing protein [Theileria equi strain WA]|uniref:Signal peptide containing protein n=1 Tax=Theileria equi strain WA TaxID=1537102 RepID=L1LA78_THEEQ|nr:signal peptide containing protein [Theileria equi strain WA]EKX72145.1 signal peptide containing protein [Theileria equi strain WA]|eukprot:XP_004831597.1 signal peptide containing protein [Theileria equi strain WA]